ncbi:MAG: hypothetical protein Q9163_001313 [Psora crenata]
MPSDKDRLYDALYARGAASTMPGGEDAYHWSLMTGPRKEDRGSRGLRYHAKDKSRASGQSVWEFEERGLTVGMATQMLLVRILVGKVDKSNRLRDILRRVPVVQGDRSWNCVIWVKNALEALQKDGKAMGTCQLDWKIIRDTSMRYIQHKKKQHRFDGKAEFDISNSATFDMPEGRETIA